MRFRAAMEGSLCESRRQETSHCHVVLRPGLMSCGAVSFSKRAEVLEAMAIAIR